MSFGKIISPDTSKLFNGPLAVVKVGFNGYDLGKTVTEAKLTIDPDVKPINYQQDGTKPADYVYTGIEAMLDVSFGELSMQMLEQVVTGMKKQASETLVMGRNLYQSLRNTEAAVLKLTAVSGDGLPSENIEDTWFFYEAIPIIPGDIMNWGADSQRVLNVQFKIMFYTFGEGESAAFRSAFGYVGDPITADVPAALWPEGPVIDTAEVTATDTIELTFDKNVAFQSSFVAGHYAVKVNNDLLVLPTAGVIATNVLTLTFPAATFAVSDVIDLTITSTALQDTETTPNLYQGVENKDVVNTLT